MRLLIIYVSIWAIGVSLADYVIILFDDGYYLFTYYLHSTYFASVQLRYCNDDDQRRAVWLKMKKFHSKNSSF